MTLDSGDGVWVVYHVANWTDPGPLKGTPRFAKNKNAHDLAEGVRVFAMDQLRDGSVAFFDFPAKVRREKRATREGEDRNAEK